MKKYEIKLNKEFKIKNPLSVYDFPESFFHFSFGKYTLFVSKRRKVYSLIGNNMPFKVETYMNDFSVYFTHEDADIVFAKYQEYLASFLSNYGEKKRPIQLELF